MRVLPLLKLLLVEEELAAGRVLVHRVAAVHAAQGVQAESGMREFERVEGGNIIIFSLRLSIVLIKNIVSLYHRNYICILVSC